MMFEFLKKMSTWGIVFLILLIAGGAVVGVAAINWYYSTPQTTTVQAYDIVMYQIPSTVKEQQELTITGMVMFGQVKAANINVHLFKNDVDIAQTVTNANGDYTFTYVVNDPVGTPLVFKTGVNSEGT